MNTLTSSPGAGSTLAGTLISLAPTRAISCASLLETPCR